MNATGLRNPDWGIPVVYSRAPDGRLFQLPTEQRQPIADDRPPSAISTVPVSSPAAQPALADIGDAPPPDRRAINLPATTTQLIGRNQDVAAAHALLKDSRIRLVTLTGAGGTGKTRLAIQIAADLLDSFAHGICFVDLAPIGQRDLVLATIAHTLGVKETGDQPILEILKEFLRDRELLLVLDNFEQVLEAAPLIAAALAALPRLQVLVTSRAALRISGEYEFPVSPLALPDVKRLPPLAELAQNPAVALFTERAQAVNHRFALDAANAPAVAEICARLDGLPLAIELAAVRSNVLNPPALLARLTSRLDLLTGGARDLAARQQTLRGAIAWSYDLLNEAERVLFARLATFVGGCTLEAAEQICGNWRLQVGNAQPLAPSHGDLAAVLDTLGSLVDKSLLRRFDSGAEPRFMMLETIREYAQLRLAASGETAELRRRHAAFFQELAERAEPELVGPRQADWLDRLEDEHDNLRSALNWVAQQDEPEPVARLSIALIRFWLAHGHLTECRQWLERSIAGLRAAQPTGEPELAARRALVEAKALNGAGLLAWTQGDYLRAQTCYAESLGLCRAADDRPGAARALTNLGLLADALGDYPAAKASYEEALALYRALNDTIGMARALNNIGNVALAEHEYAAAYHSYSESQALFRQLGDQRSIAIVLGNLGEVALNQREYLQARAHYQQGLQLRRALGDKEGLAYCLEGLAAIDLAQGAAPRAAQLWGAAATLREAIGAPLAPSDQAILAGRVAQARALVAPPEWDAAWSYGQTMSLEQILDIAAIAA
jgi:predicted ATPase